MMLLLVLVAVGPRGDAGTHAAAAEPNSRVPYIHNTYMRATNESRTQQSLMLLSATIYGLTLSNTDKKNRCLSFLKESIWHKSLSRCTVRSSSSSPPIQQRGFVDDSLSGEGRLPSRLRSSTWPRLFVSLIRSIVSLVCFVTQLDLWASIQTCFQRILSRETKH